MNLGFIGLGRMGHPMSQHLLSAGHQLTVHNRSRAVVDQLASLGAIAAANPKEVAARSDIVMTCLTNTESVESVYFGPDGLFASAREGQLFIDHSTVGLDTTAKCVEAAGARGAAFLDAPVSGGPAGAAGATLTIMVGGSEDDFSRALPVFEILGKNIRRCGPNGSGTAIKLVNQLLVAINMAGVAEALIFGLKAGADPRMVLEVVGTGFGGSRMLERTVPLALARNFKPGTAVNLIIKDLGLIKQLASELGTPLQMADRAEEIFLAARNAGLGDDDMSGLIRPNELAAGVQVSG